jgi:SAM-dependent methyltransferase
MPAFARFDQRAYPIVDVRTGYGEWVSTYERTVSDLMDVALLDQLTTVDWAGVTAAADLGCGTGRTGQWLTGRGVATLDGVDLTPEMLARAADRGIYRSLVEGDVTATGLDSGAYDLVTACLIDEHLAELEPLYLEARRLAVPNAAFVVVCYHPQFIMTSGMATHFTNAAGEHIAISTHVHLLSDHVRAGLAAGWVLAEMRENLVDESWLAVKPRWGRFLDHPFSVAFSWRAPA